MIDKIDKNIDIYFNINCYICMNENKKIEI